MVEVLFVANFTRAEQERFSEACSRAQTQAVVVPSAEAGRNLLTDGAFVPRGIFIDADLVGIDTFVAWVRGDPRWMRLPLIAIAAHPTEGAFVRAHALGVDDVALRSDPGTATRRIATLSTDPVAPVDPWRGKAWIVHPDGDRRRVVGRVLRQAGFELGFAGSGAELLESIGNDPRAELAVIGGDIGDAAERELIEALRAATNNPALPAVLLRPPTSSDHVGEARGRLGVVTDDGAVDNLLFVVNELGMRLGGELRSSQRLLFSTLCAFRRARELTPEFGLTYNVSRDGLYVRTLDPPTMGTLVWLELRPPGTTSIVHLRAKVAWARKAGTSGGTAPPGFGVQIDEEQCPALDLQSYRVAYQAFREEQRPYLIEHPALNAKVDADRPAVATKKSAGRVLVADDDDVLINFYRRILESEGFEVSIARDGQEAVETFAKERFDAVLTDIEMPRLSGLGVLRGIRALNETVPVIIATGAPSTATAIEAVERGAYRYLTKPVEAGALKETVRRAVQVGRLATLKQEALALHADAVGDRGAQEHNEAFDRALGALFLHYQPIVTWSTQSVMGYEALVRSKEASLPHPGALFEAAEKLGRLQDLGRGVRLLAPGPMETRAERLFVNLHPSDLADEELFDKDSPLALMASRVTLEITEGTSLSHVADSKRRITDLKAMGFAIAVDDIGAGYAGLTSFAQIEPDVAKLDMTLIRDVNRIPRKQAIIRSFCELCGDLNIAMICEGVETAQERDTLVELGCDLFQGYLFAKPGLPFPEPTF